MTVSDSRNLCNPTLLRGLVSNWPHLVHPLPFLFRLRMLITVKEALQALVDYGKRLAWMEKEGCLFAQFHANHMIDVQDERSLMNSRAKLSFLTCRGKHTALALHKCSVQHIISNSYVLLYV